MGNELVKQDHGGAIHQGRPKGYLNPNAGRPTDLTPEVSQQIVEDIKNGNYAQVAAQRAGINEQTFYSWLQKGENGPEIYREFTKAVLQASGEAENVSVAQLRRGGTGKIMVEGEFVTAPGDWKASLAWLERRFPKRWGRQQRLEIVTAPEADIEF